MMLQLEKFYSEHALSHPVGKSMSGADVSTAAGFGKQLQPLLDKLAPEPDNSPAPAHSAGLRELGTAEVERIQDTARQLEALLMYQVLKQMWASIPDSTLMPEGSAGQMFREMWLEKVADQVSLSGGGIGVARVVEGQLMDQARRTYSAQQIQLKDLSVNQL